MNRKDQSTLKPMMDPEEVEFIRYALRHRLKGRAQALEFGSGGSTLVFSRYAQTWTSIEHNPEWAKRTRSALANQKNVEVRLCAPEFTHFGMTPAEDGQFTRYIAAASEFCPRSGYNFVLVDGRARIDCILALHQNRVLQPDAIVVLHDFRRSRYLARLNEVLQSFDLTQALMPPYLRGIGVFEYRADKNEWLPEISTKMGILSP